jgi:hypothetical protein
MRARRAGCPFVVRHRVGDALDRLGAVALEAEHGGTDELALGAHLEVGRASRSSRSPATSCQPTMVVTARVDLHLVEQRLPDRIHDLGEHRIEPIERRRQERDRRRVLGRLRQREQEPIAEIVHHRTHARASARPGHELEHVDEPAVHRRPDVPLATGEHANVLFDRFRVAEVRLVLRGPATHHHGDALGIERILLVRLLAERDVPLA